MSTTITKNSLDAIRERLAETKAKHNFASRKTHTKTYAKTHNLFLPAGELSVYKDNIDWIAAIAGKYDTDFETWSNIYWSSKPSRTRGLKDMAPDDLAEYKRWHSRKSKFSSQLKLAEVELSAFLEKIDTTEDIFFADAYGVVYKEEHGTKASAYNLESWFGIIEQMI